MYLDYSQSLYMIQAAHNNDYKFPPDATAKDPTSPLLF